MTTAHCRRATRSTGGVSYPNSIVAWCVLPVLLGAAVSCGTARNREISTLKSGQSTTTERAASQQAVDVSRWRAWSVPPAVGSSSFTAAVEGCAATVHASKLETVDGTLTFRFRATTHKAEGVSRCLAGTAEWSSSGVTLLDCPQPSQGHYSAPAAKRSQLRLGQDVRLTPKCLR
jgi:hypothetical protein